MSIIVDGVMIRISFETRPDGGLRIWSDDLPGLVLSHKDPALVLGDVEPSARVILNYMKEQAAK